MLCRRPRAGCGAPTALLESVHPSSQCGGSVRALAASRTQAAARPLYECLGACVTYCNPSDLPLRCAGSGRAVAIGSQPALGRRLYCMLPLWTAQRRRRLASVVASPLGPALRWELGEQLLAAGPAGSTGREVAVGSCRAS